MKKSLLIITGLLLLATALFLSEYNYSQEDFAKEESERAVRKILEQKEENRKRGEDEEGLELEGKQYVGILEIPSLGLILPVQGAPWSYEKLKVSPCIYSGSADTKNMILAAHNYKAHFGRIKQLKKGDTILYTDLSGTKFSYRVSSDEVLSPSEIGKLKEDGDWALTLFTCTYQGSKRYVLRCRE